MAKFPNWVRPALSERQLVGEEKRLDARGLTAEQVRADLIRVAAHHEGDSRNAVLNALGETLEISGAYSENAVSGRVPMGDALLDGLYGPPPANTLHPDWARDPESWGPMVPDAIKAGLVAAEPNSQTGAGGVSLPTVDLAAPAVSATATSPGLAETAPAVAEPTIPAPELAPDAATPAPLFSTTVPTSLRAPAAGQDGEGTLREGSTIPTGLQGQSPVQPRDAAGEGDHSHPPPPPTNSFTRVLCELDDMMDAAAVECRDAETAAAAAARRMALARLTYDALVDARNSVAQAHARAQELIANPPVDMAVRRAA